MKPKAIPMLFNCLLYNIMWLGCIVYKEKFLPFVLIWAIWHVFKVASIIERAMVLFVVLLGVILDSALMQIGIFQFSANQTEFFIPIWLWAIWLSFSLTIYHSLSPLARSSVAQILIGALVVPIAYFIGRKLDAVDFGYSDTTTFITLALVWGILLPSIFWFKQTLESFMGDDNEKMESADF